MIWCACGTCWIRAEVATIPWTDVVGMRNRLIHAYFDVDLNLVWNTVEEDLPPLIADFFSPTLAGRRRNPNGKNELNALPARPCEVPCDRARAAAVIGAIGA